MRMVMTGADGFLGSHTRLRLRALTDHDVICVELANPGCLSEPIGSADTGRHFAGIQRGDRALHRLEA
jgi:UDP-2-acetamido-2,6-beta-L-arabino-hexul-4-ose reductase